MIKKQYRAPSIKGIIRKTDRSRKQKSKKITLRLVTVQKFETPQGGSTMRFLYNVNSQETAGKKYKVEFRTLPNKLVTEDNWYELGKGKFPMLVNCNCPDFKFRWEAVLWAKGASRKQESTGEMPDITNPTYQLKFCKHSLAAWENLKGYILRKTYSNIGPARKI